MKHKGCPYRTGVRGRAMRARRGIGSPTITAVLACSGCGREGEKPVRSDATPHQIDDKFRHSGWLLDPHECPTCRAKTREKAVASKQSPEAVRAQVAVITALQTHFDTEAGAYAEGWDDQRIAKDAGMALEHVVDVRRSAFGELKEPSEVRKLREDLTALDALLKETTASISAEIATLRSRLGGISKRWAA